MIKIFSILLITLSINLYGQDSLSIDTINVKKKFKLEKRECEELPLGLGLMLSGTTLLAMANSTEKYPPNVTFLKQGVRSQAIIVSGVLIFSGFVLTAAGY